ncbi:MAG: ABC transporter permease [Ilumatobacteraceae bacterium]|nr:ABC transporter permease [Ilumatobacteraceae bacterium]
MSATRLMFVRTAHQAVRHPGVAFGQSIAPALLIGTIFTALFESVAALPGFPLDSYGEWVLPGTLFLSAVVGAGFTAAELLRDIASGFIDRVRLTPALPASLVAGRAGFEAVRGSVAAVVILAVGILRGAADHVTLGGAIAVLALTTGFAVSWNGIFFLTAVVTRNPAAVLGLQPLFFPIMLFSTWFGPRTLMPGWYAQISDLNPVTAYLDATRSILRNTPDWSTIGVAVAFELVLGAVTYGLATHRFRRSLEAAS